MAINDRDFTTGGQWAKSANTNIPAIPVSGQAYRNALLTKAQIENGQNYDNVADSAFWNQYLFGAGGMALEAEQYGIPRWSPLTNYIGNASIAIGNDGNVYRAIADSGPLSSGSQNPVTTTGYWQEFGDYLSYEFWVLKRLTASLDVYVATTGSDTIGDGSLANPWKTIQFAVNTIAETYFLGPYHVTINVAAGTYNENIVLPFYLSTTGIIVFKGDAGRTTNVTGVGVGGTSRDSTFNLKYPCIYWIDTTLIRAPVDTDDTTQDDCVSISDGHVVIINCELRVPVGNNSSYCVNASDAGIISLGTGNPADTTTIDFNTLGTNTSTIIAVGQLGKVYINSNMTMNGTVIFSTVAATNLGQIYRNPVQLPTIIGTVTGKRYTSTVNALINTQGGGINYFPGTVAGTTATGGQYL